MNDLTPDPAIKNDQQHWPAGHPAVKYGRVGVLLLNLGTPDGTDYWPMRRYLKEFLSDARVIEEPRWKWWPILNLIILTVRPSKKGKDYADHLEQRDATRDRSRPSRAARPSSSPCASKSIRASSSTGPCATPTRRRRAASRR